MKPSILVITGPTASGKTTRAVDCARKFDGEIVSADSRQIYRSMDIGTGKDLEEYGDVPYHLIDVAPAGYKYNLYEYLRDATAAISDIRRRGKLPILAGGTGMYVEAVLNGLNLPQVPPNEELRERLRCKTLAELTEILGGMKRLHNTTDVDSVQRAIRAIEIETFYQEHPEEAKSTLPNPIAHYLLVCVDIPREARRERITKRLQSRLNNGMVDEVQRLLDTGISPDDLIYYGLEYKFITEYLTGAKAYDEMVQGLEIAIHQFAKRQMTWFRGMERRGFEVHYLAYDLPKEEFVAKVEGLMRCEG